MVHLEFKLKCEKSSLFFNDYLPCLIRRVNSVEAASFKLVICWGMCKAPKEVNVNRLLCPLWASFTINIFKKLTFSLDPILCILLRWNLIYIFPKLQMAANVFAKFWRSDQKFSRSIFNLSAENVKKPTHAQIAVFC